MIFVFQSFPAFKVAIFIHYVTHEVYVFVLISFNGITFHSWKESSYRLLTQEHWGLVFFFCILTFFRPPCLKSEFYIKVKVLFFIFGLEGHRKVFCILSSSLIISVGTFDINEIKTIFEIAKVLKTIILHSSVRWRICQTFNIAKHSEF